MRIILIGHTYLAKENRKAIKLLNHDNCVEVISPNHFGGMIHRYKESVGFDKASNIYFDNVIFLKFLSSSAYILSWKALKRIDRTVDIVHIELDPFHPLFFQIVLYRIIFCKRFRIVSTIKQNTYTTKSKVFDFCKDYVAIRLSRYVDRFIAVNIGVSEIYKNRFKVDHSRIVMCTQLGVDTNLFTPTVKVPSNRNVLSLGYVGRIVEYKGIWDLIAACEMLWQENRTISLSLLGGGPEVDKVKEMAKNYPWLEYYKPVSHKEVPKFLNKLDVFIMPSLIKSNHVEHDSHAVMEAMSCGLCCVIADSGSNREVVGDCGLLYEPGNLSQLVDRLKQTFDLEDRVLYSTAARKRIEQNYSLEEICKQYINTYAEVL